MSRTRALLAAIVFTLCACNDAVRPLIPGVSIVSGDRVTDTVLTPLPQPLVVRVLGEDLAPIAGVEVRFLPHPINFLGRYRTRVSPYVDTTDETGRVEVAVYLGNAAGEDTVIARVPALETEAIARFTVLPGNSAGVIVSPRDTTVYVERSVRLRGSAVDRWGNPRAEPVAYSTSSPAVRLSRDVVTGVAIGRASVIGSAGAWRDTGWVSVVPVGAAAALQPHLVSGDTARVVFFNFDGSGVRSFDVEDWSAARPDWAASGDVIVLEQNGHLVLADSSGPKRRLLEPTVGLVQELHAQYSADGAWIYFAGVPPGRRIEIWRARADGSAAERVGPEADYYLGDTQPSPSPDGTRVVYARTPTCCYNLLLQVLHLATGAIDTLHRADGTPIPGTTPRWSPVSDVIAYTNPQAGWQNENANTIWLMDPNGSNQRAVSRPEHVYWPWVDWSADGRWIIAASFDQDVLHLIDPASGLTLPLGFAKSFRQPTWRP